MRRQAQLVLRFKLKDKLDIFLPKNSTSHIFAQSFFSLTIFHSCLMIMMRACKARASDEGGMMKKLSGQNLYKLDIFCYVLFVVNEIVILSENSIPE